MTEQLNVVLIEDEPATARNLAYLLKQINPRINIVAALQSVAEAIVWFSQGSEPYNLIFSDIRLSDGLSFEIFKQTTIVKPIIFVTAYHDYAIEAFKNNGIGYILKPFDQEEIRLSIEKFELLVNQNSAQRQQQMVALWAELNASTNRYKKSFLIHYRGKLLPVATAKIQWFYTANEIVYAQTLDTASYTVEFTLEQLEKQLDPEQFFRANRQFIINRNAVDEIAYFFNGRLSVKLHPQPHEKVLVSKARAMEFRRWMDR